MALAVETLETSFEQVKPHADDFAASFYATLFARHPEVEPLFTSTDFAHQRQKLVASLAFVVENLRSPDKLAPAVQGLGARHVNYGVLPEHYPWVGRAMLDTFARYLGSNWTPEVEQAWKDAYATIAELMLAGAEYPPGTLDLNR